MNPHRCLTRTQLALAIIVAPVLLTGCATPGYKLADQTGDAIAAYETNIDKLKQAIHSSLTAMNQMPAVASTNPRPAYGAFADEVKRLDVALTRATQRAELVKTRATTYFAAWSQEIPTIVNPELHNLAEQRKAKQVETFNRATAAIQAADAVVKSFVIELKDIQKSLGNDLTVEGIDAIKPLFQRAAADGAKAGQQLDTLVNDLNATGAALVPNLLVPQEPAPAPAAK